MFAKTMRNRSFQSAFFCVFLCASIVSCRGFHRSLEISGSITVAGSFVNALEHREESLFIIVKDAGGVPIAVKRIVNPRFPIDYSLGPGELLIPGVHPRFPLTVEVELNSKGKIGPPVPGDFIGVCPNPVGPRQKRVDIVINRYL